MRLTCIGAQTFMNLVTNAFNFEIEYLNRSILDNLGKCDRPSNLNELTGMLDILVHMFQNILELFFIFFRENWVYDWVFFAVCF